MLITSSFSYRFDWRVICVSQFPKPKRRKSCPNIMPKIEQPIAISRTFSDIKVAPD